ncbi:unnamed protein product [Arabis nemorensis]|uniref:Uncharacterized protein n=1 Tax=Arabis nemorensis TaxID=586526 RepID=A0A565BI79_9BRAS|nr:unnamed protein product [Arabis nemorensis]
MSKDKIKARILKHNAGLKGTIPPSRFPRTTDTPPPRSGHRAQESRAPYYRGFWSTAQRMLAGYLRYDLLT